VYPPAVQVGCVIVAVCACVCAGAGGGANGISQAEIPQVSTPHAPIKSKIFLAFLMLNPFLFFFVFYLSCPCKWGVFLSSPLLF
jgi:hypothetical protein